MDNDRENKRAEIVRHIDETKKLMVENAKLTRENTLYVDNEIKKIKTSISKFIDNNINEIPPQDLAELYRLLDQDKERSRANLNKPILFGKEDADRRAGVSLDKLDDLSGVNDLLKTIPLSPSAQQDVSNLDAQISEANKNGRDLDQKRGFLKSDESYLTKHEAKLKDLDSGGSGDTPSWVEIYPEVYNETSSEGSGGNSSEGSGGNSGSLVEDFADPNTEMPSYMDPDD